MEIATDRLVLRQPKIRDSYAIFAYRSDNDANRYQGWIPQNHSEVEKRLAQPVAPLGKVGMWYQLVINTEDGAVIGDIGIHFRDKTTSELGCTIASNYHGLGYAYEALSAVIAHLAEHTLAQTAMASVDPRNRSAIRLVKRLGMVRTELIKDAYQVRGEWIDDLIYEMMLSRRSC